MLLELAIADAYGAGFEYTKPKLIAEYNDLSRYVQHPRHGIVPGCYTDDTQMTLAIAELLIEGADWTPINIASKFVEVFKRDPREGYAQGFYNFLQSVKDGEDFLARIRPDSDKSGAAMRAAPLGLLSDTANVIEKCRVQAAVTHNTPLGIEAAIAAALSVHYFAHDHGPKADLGAYLCEHVPGDIAWDAPYTGKVKSKGWMSTQAAVTAVMRNTSLSALLRDCIAFTGDVDTVATIALAAASVSDEYELDLPTILAESLERGPYGYEYLVKLDNQLKAQ
jgi:ADP-ribosyl-[dinitrogen reductase] hydrolase